MPDDADECPVCHYDGLTTKPYANWPPPPELDIKPPYEDSLGSPSYEVCARCGFEFANDDNPGTAEPLTFEKYRAEWERNGCPVFDPEMVAVHSGDRAAARG